MIVTPPPPSFPPALTSWFTGVEYLGCWEDKRGERLMLIGYKTNKEMTNQVKAKTKHAEQALREPREIRSFVCFIYTSEALRSVAFSHNVSRANLHVVYILSRAIHTSVPGTKGQVFPMSTYCRFHEFNPPAATLLLAPLVCFTAAVLAPLCSAPFTAADRVCLILLPQGCIDYCRDEGAYFAGTESDYS